MLLMPPCQNSKIGAMMVIQVLPGIQKRYKQIQSVLISQYQPQNTCNAVAVTLIYTFLTQNLQFLVKHTNSYAVLQDCKTTGRVAFSKVARQTPSPRLEIARPGQTHRGMNRACLDAKIWHISKKKLTFFGEIERFSPNCQTTGLLLVVCGHRTLGVFFACDAHSRVFS